MKIILTIEFESEFELREYNVHQQEMREAFMTQVDFEEEMRRMEKYEGVREIVIRLRETNPATEDLDDAEVIFDCLRNKYYEIKNDNKE